MPHLTPDRLWSIPRVGAPTVAGDVVVVPVTTHADPPAPPVTRLWRAPLDGSDPIALTRSDASATKPALSGDASHVAFLRSVDDHRQVHVMPMHGGEPLCVTAMPHGVIGFRWFPDGHRLLVIADLDDDAPTIEATGTAREERSHRTTTARVTESAVYRYWDRWLTDGHHPHLFVVSVDGRTAPRDLTPDSRRWMRWDNTGDPTDDIAVSPDGQEVAVCFETSDPPHDDLRWSLFTIGVESGVETEVTTGDPGHVSGPRYSRDGRHLVYGRTEDPDFYADRVRLMRRDRHTGETVELTDGWDRSPSGWSLDGDRVVLVAEDRGQQPVWTLDLTGGEPKRLAGSGTFTAPAALADGRIVAVGNRITSPPEAYQVSGDSAERLTRFTDDAMADVTLPEVEEVTVTGARGDVIQTWVVTPRGIGTPAPLVHMIHGGPHGAFGDTWHWRWNAAVFAGDTRVAALVNFHGSTGFGQEFAESIRGEWGSMPTEDVEAATDRLVSDGTADPDRLAIAGGSYGGYLVSWLISHTERYRCAVAHAAVTDLPGMYASDLTSDRASSWGAEVWDDLDRVNRWSPAAHAGGYSTPTLVIHGEKDYRVPVTQGLELYGVLRAKGVEARLVHYPDENHWILAKGNSLHWYGEVLRWLDRHIG